MKWYKKNIDSAEKALKRLKIPRGEGRNGNDVQSRGPLGTSAHGAIVDIDAEPNAPPAGGASAPASLPPEGGGRAGPAPDDERVPDLESQISERARDLESLADKLESVRSEYGDIVSKLMATKREYNKKLADIKLIRKEHEVMLAKARDVRSGEVAGTPEDATADSYQKMVESLKAQLAAAQRERDEMRSRVDADILLDGALPASPDDPPNVVRAANAVVESIKRKLAISQRELREAREELDGARRELAGVRRELDDARRKLAGLEGAARS